MPDSTNKKGRKQHASPDKLNRWLKIVRSLKKGQGRSCADWACIYGVVREQICRDIGELRKRGWPIETGADGRYVFAEELTRNKYVELLKALAPDFLNLSVIKDFLEAMDSSLRSELMSSLGYIPDTESDKHHPPRLMTLASFEIFTPRRPPGLTPQMREQLSFLLEPLSQLDAAAQKSLFDSISP